MADYTERIETKPLSQAEFERLVVSRFEDRDFLRDKWFGAMYVSKREDNVCYIEAIMMIDDENSYWVEIGVDPGVERKRKRYSRDYVPKEDAIRIFKSVLVDYDMPDIGDWDDFTDEQEYYLHADRIISRFPFIENPTEDDEFAYVEALDFMIGEIQENKVENIKKLAQFYGERQLYELEQKYLEMAVEEAERSTL